MIRFLRHAQHLLSAVEDAVVEMRCERTEAFGAVTIAVTDTISGYFLPAFLASARRSFPSIEIKLEEVPRFDIEQSLLNGKYNFAIALTSNIAHPKKLACETLIRSPRRLWMALDHPLAQRETVSLSDVAECAYILLDMDDQVETVEKYWSSYGLFPNTVFRSKSIEGVRSLVAQGFGVTILSELVYRAWSHDGGRIRRKSLADKIPTMDVGLVARCEDRLSPPAALLTDLVRKSKTAILRSEAV